MYFIPKYMEVYEDNEAEIKRLKMVEAAAIS